MAEHVVSFPRKILYYCILIAVLLVTLELISRAVYYQRWSSHASALVQVLQDFRNGIKYRRQVNRETQRLREDQYLIRPQWSKAENDELIDETMDGDRGVYVPWAEFAYRDIRAKYVNVSDHIRKSIPDRSDSGAEKPFRIFFLGGSTMYGFNVSDSETIPADFVRAYRNKFPQGRPIRVINYGTPFYYSYQELMQLTDRIFRDDKPDMVVMLDGLNDCVFAGAVYQRMPVLAPGMGDSISRPGTRVEKGVLPDNAQLPSGISPDSAYKAVALHYLDNIRHARDLTSSYHIPLYCFWQPIPYYDYPNQKNDPICGALGAPRFPAIYGIIREKAADIPYLYFLGNMLHDEKGLPFADQIHYSPYFTRVIAEKMLSEIDFR
jgi:hypothetical protein